MRRAVLFRPQLKKTLQIALSLIAAALLALALNAGYAMDFLVEKAGDRAHKLQEFITPGKIIALSVFYAVLLIFTVLLSRFSGKKITRFLKSAFQEIQAGILNRLTSITPFEKIFLTAIVVLHGGLNLYSALTIPITNDEAFTYINYVHRGMAAAVTLYNEPNNHVFYSVLANIFDTVPGLSSGVKIRIPSGLAGLFTLPVFYFLAVKLTNKKSAAFAVILFSGFYLTAKYHFLARGYGFMMLFFILNLTAAEILRSTPKNTGAKLIFVLSAVLGFYTHPAYLIPFVICFAHPLFGGSRKQLVQPLIFMSVVTAAGVITLYFPLITLNGFAAFTSNSGLEKPDFLSLLAQITNNITGVFTQGFYDQPALIVSGLLLFIIGLFIVRRTPVFYTFLFSVFVIFCVLAGTGSPMFVRNLLWLSVFFACIIGSVFGELAGKLPGKRYVFVSVCTFLIIMFSVRTLLLQQTFRTYYHRLFQAREFAHHLPADFGVLYSEHTSDYYTILRYEAVLKQGKKGGLERSNFDRNFPYDRVLNIKKNDDSFHLKSTFSYRKEYEDDYISLWQIVDEKK